ncbi:unnamed protein product [Miscanthus lutarioriparius]|uniref:NAD-dependent epimerase/dehydratase domain-containing protein n=1 Tax=Miscanthus lutarioriparius TaxID=422564 RepID=A0A811ME62_9POAL|nr:unnamed protein product [Miscanthus lutarioriparius]
MASGEEGKGETVLVTSASGFIGSTLVRGLLGPATTSAPASSTPVSSTSTAPHSPALLSRQRHHDAGRKAGPLPATRSSSSPRWCADDRAETDHLLALAAGAGDGRLSFFRCGLLDGAALLDATRGCSGVFHLASPCTVDPVKDPQNQLMVPAVEGTRNVVRAAKDAGGVRRVVVTSSISAIVPSPGWPADEVLDERCWTDIDYCEKNGVWYPASKALAEKAAWKFAEENGLDVVVVNPGTVLGPMIPPAINASMAMFCRLLKIQFKFSKDTQPGLVREEVGSKKLIALGLQVTPMEKIIRDAVESLKSRGHIS